MVEEIPGTDCVSRHVDSPHKWSREEQEFVDKKLFEFPGGQPESLFWRKYAEKIEDVHKIGCERQSAQRLKGRQNWTYEGSVTSSVAAIRALETVTGHGFKVEHAPEEGIWHAHISFLPKEGVQLTKAEKTDLKEWLGNAFGGLESHTCPGSDFMCPMAAAVQ